MRNLYSNHVCPQAPKLLFFIFHSILFVQRGKEKFCSLNQPQHMSPGFKDRLFVPPWLSQDCFSHPSFGWVLQQATLGHGTARGGSPAHLQLYGRWSTPEERAARQANSSTKGSHRQDSSLFSASPPSWGLILYSGHTGVRAASALLLRALWQPHSYSF